MTLKFVHPRRCQPHVVLNPNNPPLLAGAGDGVYQRQELHHCASARSSPALFNVGMTTEMLRLTSAGPLLCGVKGVADAAAEKRGEACGPSEPCRNSFARSRCGIHKQGAEPGANRMRDEKNG